MEKDIDVDKKKMLIKRIKRLKLRIEREDYESLAELKLLVKQKEILERHLDFIKF